MYAISRMHESVYMFIINCIALMDVCHIILSKVNIRTVILNTVQIRHLSSRNYTAIANETMTSDFQCPVAICAKSNKRVSIEQW